VSNAGPVAAGIIGRRKFIYDPGGDAINLASRMESTGIPDAIQVTRPVFEKLKDRYRFEARGSIEVKGKGSVETWVFRGEDAPSASGSQAGYPSPFSFRASAERHRVRPSSKPKLSIVGQIDGEDQ